MSQLNPMASPVAGKLVAVKAVEVILIHYKDPHGKDHITYASVGDRNIQLFDSRVFGLSQTSGPTGTAPQWLVKLVFESLGREYVDSTETRDQVAARMQEQTKLDPGSVRG